MKFQRSSGILLHPTSLPNDLGIGTLGQEAYDFVDFLHKSSQKLWQICPVGPTGYGNSPYQSFSAFAGNYNLISLEKLKDSRLLSPSDLSTDLKFDDDCVDYEKAIAFRFPLLKLAVSNLRGRLSKITVKKIDSFFRENSFWLDDYSLFMALKDNFKGRPWYEWPDEIRLRDRNTVEVYKERLSEEILFHKHLQYIFYNQWDELKSYANSKGVKIIGDIPIFVAMDSSDTWANPSQFLLDKNLNPTSVAGVPPDYFSETGQLWGNPLYNWDRLKADGYKWWIDVIRAKLHAFDVFRIDHFRGFASYWEIPFGEDTAINGKWVPAPGKELFTTIENTLGELPIIAEDLGHITPDVIELCDHCGFPGMKVLQFLLESEDGVREYKTKSPEHTVVYTGTHDNDTVVGWFSQISDETKEFVLKQLNSNGDDIAFDLLKEAWSSPAVMAIAPLQDVLGLGPESRMNTPGTIGDNWKWRVNKSDLTDEVASKLNKLTTQFSR